MLHQISGYVIVSPGAQSVIVSVLVIGCLKATATDTYTITGRALKLCFTLLTVEVVL